MARLLTILFIVASLHAVAQNYPITNIKISLPPNPEANMANWGRRVPMFTIAAAVNANRGDVNALLAKSSVLVMIKQNGVKVCGAFSPETAPTANFNGRNKFWNGENAVKLIGQVCVLPAGDYQLSVQFFYVGDSRTIPLSEEKIKPFSIRGDAQLAFGNEKLTDQQAGVVADAPNNKQRQNKNIPGVQQATSADSAYNRQRPNKNMPGIPPGATPVQVNTKQRPDQNAAGQKAAGVADPDNNKRPPVKNAPGIPSQPVVDPVNNKRPPGKNPPDVKPGTVVDPNGTKTPPNKNNPDPQTGVVVVPPNAANGVEINISANTVANLAIGLFKKRNTPCGAVSSEASVECAGAGPVAGLPVYKVTIRLTNNQIDKVKQCPAVITGIMVAPGGEILSPQVSFPISIASNATASISFTYTPPPGEQVNPTFAFTGTWGGNKNSPIQVQTAVTLPVCITNTTTTCDCGKWTPLVANDVKYGAGSKITWKCGREFEFSSTYHCGAEGQSCAAVTSWEIRKDGLVVKTGMGANEIKDSFIPHENGIYRLTLNATCNGVKCRPLFYPITVEDCTTCDCGEWSSPLTGIQNSDGKKITNVACGETATLTPGYYNFTLPDYACKAADNGQCLAAYNWTVSGGDAVVNGTGKTIAYNFTKPGLYTVTTTPVCGDKKCTPCIFTIKIEGILPPVVIPPVIISETPPTPSVVINVKKPASPDTSFINAKYYYELDKGPTYTYAELTDKVLNVQYTNNYAAVENIKLSIYDVAAGVMVTARAPKSDKLNSVTGLNRLSIALNNYNIEPGRLYFLTVSVFSGDYHIKFKVINNHAK